MKKPRKLHPRKKRSRNATAVDNKLLIAESYRQALIMVGLLLLLILAGLALREVIAANAVKKWQLEQDRTVAQLQEKNVQLTQELAFATNTQAKVAQENSKLSSENQRFTQRLVKYEQGEPLRRLHGRIITADNRATTTEYHKPKPTVSGNVVVALVEQLPQKTPTAQAVAQKKVVKPSPQVIKIPKAQKTVVPKHTVLARATQTKPTLSRSVQTITPEEVAIAPKEAEAAPPLSNMAAQESSPHEEPTPARETTAREVIAQEPLPEPAVEKTVEQKPVVIATNDMAPLPKHEEVKKESRNPFSALFALITNKASKE